MCTSVPQIVVAVMRIRACPQAGCGFGTSSSASRFFSLNTTAFIVFIAVPFQSSVRDLRRGAVAVAGSIAGALVVVGPRLQHADIGAAFEARRVAACREA